jgi:hypothetical protein
MVAGYVVSLGILAGGLDRGGLAVLFWGRYLDLKPQSNLGSSSTFSLGDMGRLLCSICVRSDLRCWEWEVLEPVIIVDSAKIETKGFR